MDIAVAETTAANATKMPSFFVHAASPETQPARTQNVHSISSGCPKTDAAEDHGRQDEEAQGHIGILGHAMDDEKRRPDDQKSRDCSLFPG